MMLWILTIDRWIKTKMQSLHNSRRCGDFPKADWVHRHEHYVTTLWLKHTEESQLFALGRRDFILDEKFQTYRKLHHILSLKNDHKENKSGLIATRAEGHGRLYNPRFHGVKAEAWCSLCKMSGVGTRGFWLSIGWECNLGVRISGSI